MHLTLLARQAPRLDRTGIVLQSTRPLVFGGTVQLDYFQILVSAFLLRLGAELGSLAFAARLGFMNDVLRERRQGVGHPCAADGIATALDEWIEILPRCSELW